MRMHLPDAARKLIHRVHKGCRNMSRRVVITGLGPVTGLGLGIKANWRALLDGRSAVGPIEAFDPSGFDCRVAAEVDDLKVSRFVPKTYRKATKVMARDIEMAVAAADLAARDADLVTKGTANPKAPDAELSYQPSRVGAHIGAGLIAAELNELTDALIEARNGQGGFDMHKWGAEGINHLTPLWLLKYLPNMLACHVTIIHDAQGPSNTITCAEASSELSIGESWRVIQRGAADLCFCGGADSKLNPMAFLRQLMTDRYNTADHNDPSTAVRPFCRTAAGCVVGEGGGVAMLEALETFEARAANSGVRAYAELAGFGASQSIHPDRRNLVPDPEGAGIVLAIEAALRDAEIGPDGIDLIVPFGLGLPESDRAEAEALRAVFGDRLEQVPLISPKAAVGNCASGAGALDVCVAARSIREQIVPAIINCTDPLPGLAAVSAPSRPHAIGHALTYSCGMGGQNAALVLRRISDQ